MNEATLHHLIKQLAEAGERLLLASQLVMDNPGVPKKVVNKVTHQTKIAQAAIQAAIQTCLDELKETGQS